MSERSANIIGGIFLMLFGIALLLTGGGCTVLWVAMASGSYGDAGGTIIFVLLSLAVAGLGVLAIYQSVKLFRRR